jgi:DNA-binding response OmpR family regulator
MNATARVLVIEDEEPLRQALEDALAAEGFLVTSAADGESGLAQALAEAPELVLLDLMLPKRDGFSVLRALREDRVASAVIILSARGEEWDRVQGFEYGADDYVVKPFSTRELLLRIKAVLQRTEGRAPGLALEQGKARFGSVVVDFAGYTLEKDGVRHGLARRELELLRCFLAHEGEVLDRGSLLDLVWGREADPTHRTVDMHVLKLRRKIEDDPERPRHLQTVHGVGYRFVRQP